MTCKNISKFANLSGRKDIHQRALEKENKTLLMHFPESGHWSFDEEGFFDTKNLMHPEPASWGVLGNCNKGEKAQSRARIGGKVGRSF